jgi:shikimate 5-dehydrogenase
MLTNVADHLAVPKKQLVYDATCKLLRSPFKRYALEAIGARLPGGTLAGTHLLRKQAAPVCCASTGARAPEPTGL